MSWVRAVLGAVIGYVVVALGLSGVVMALWVNEWLPVGALSIVLAAIGLIVVGGFAGWVAARIAGDRYRIALFGAAGLTLAILTVNIILDVAVEPLWFKALSIGLLVPSVLLLGTRGARAVPDTDRGDTLDS